MIVDLHYFPTRPGQLEIYLRLDRFFQSKGIILRDLSERQSSTVKPDLRLIQTQGLKLEHAEGEKILDSRVPVILFERNDSVTTQAYKYLKHPNVKRMVRIGILPMELVNTTQEPYHYHLIRGDFYPPLSTEWYLNEVAMRKMVPGPCYHAFNMMSHWWGPSISLDTPRTNEIHFRGTINYPGNELITKHRSEMLEILEKTTFQKMIGTKEVNRLEYNKELQNSKIVISPYGNGEICYRDAEAMYAGCVIVKPPSDHAITEPFYFQSGRSYIQVKPDWSDLKEKIQWGLEHWDELRPMREENKERLQESVRYENLSQFCLSLLKTT